MRSKIRKEKLEEIESEVRATLSTSAFRHNLLVHVESPAKPAQKRKKEREQGGNDHASAKKEKRAPLNLKIGDRFYVPLLTWYKDEDDCKFPSPKNQWLVEGEVEAITGSTLKKYKIVFPVFGQECSKPMSYFETHATLKAPPNTIVVTTTHVNKFEPSDEE
jgi:hypothetical protein